MSDNIEKIMVFAQKIKSWADYMEENCEFASPSMDLSYAVKFQNLADDILSICEKEKEA